MRGNYLAVGVSQYGTFGTYQDCPTAVCSWGSGTVTTGKLGLRQDQDGWGSGTVPTTGDFFIPGSPIFIWCVTYTIGGAGTNLCNNRGQPAEMAAVDMSSTSDLTTKILGVKYEWGDANIKVDVVYSFHACSKKIKVEAKITNLNPATVTDPAFLISVDADQDWPITGRAFDTVDTIQGQASMAGSTYTSVCSSGPLSTIAVCMSSSAAKSYAYKGIPLNGFNVGAASRTTILNNPTGVGIEGVTATTPAPSDKAIALVSYGANLAQNEQTGDLGMYFGMGNLDDVKMPGEQRCT